MISEDADHATELANLLSEYARRPDVGWLRERIESLAASVPAGSIAALAEPYRDEPEVMAPLYERVVAAEPQNARAMVILANAYWLQGRGPELVGALANRAIAADPANRGAWHLWALAESDPRLRTQRWEQVASRFPEDSLALAALADNAASVAGAERDHGMLDLAISTYERLLDRSAEAAQRDAVAAALRSLRGWRL